MKKLALLGDLTPAQFLRKYWQKKPLLIRQAIPGMQPLLSREALFQLASRDDVESRLITHFRQKWQMQNGPFPQLPSSKRKQWTLLVQGVNLHDDKIDALLRTFNFIGDARLDDLMVSYASDRGGVGPHTDSYDVFLLQAYGQRRWRIGTQGDPSLVDGLPLKILRHFQPEQEFVLNPGDMLYLPPQYAHEGVALGECMTYSIGFRAPAYQELGEAFLQFLSEAIDLPGRFADPNLEPSRCSAKIGDTMMAAVAAELHKVRVSNDDIAIFLGEYLSEPKMQVYFNPPIRPLSPIRFRQQVAQRGLSLSRKTNMLYRGKYLFINGESFVLSRTDKAALSMLGNKRRLEGAIASAFSEDAMETLHAWYRNGWLCIG